MWLACTTPCTFTHQISYRIRHLIRLRGFGCFYYLFCDFLSVWRFIFFFSGRNFVGLIFVDIHHWHTINCCRDTNVNEINTMFLVYVVMAFHQIKRKAAANRYSWNRAHINQIGLFVITLTWYPFSHWLIDHAMLMY